MASYDPNLPNAYDKDLVPYPVRKQFFKETLITSPLHKFMGKTESSMIQVINKENGTGPTDTFSVFRELDYKNPIKNFDQVSGKGQKLVFYNDRLEIEFLRWPAKLEGVELTKLYTPIDVLGEVKPALQRLQKLNLVYSILKSATFDNYPDRAGGPVANRVVYAGGGGDAAYNASIDAAVGAMGAVTYDASGGSVDGLLVCRDIARNGGRGAYRAEKVITPYEILTKNGFADPKYVVLVDPAMYRKFNKDPQIQNQITRGVIENSGQPSLLRGNYDRARIEDVLIVECPELADFRVTAGGKTAAWNLFCGAQAFGTIFRGIPWFTEERTNHNSNIEMALNELRGQKVIKFPSYIDPTTLIENGIIHYFTRIA